MYRPQDRDHVLPHEFPLKKWACPIEDMPNLEMISLGMDSGIQHCAFCEGALVKEDGAIRDLRINNLYYYENTLKYMENSDERIYHLAKEYYENFHNLNVVNLTFEVLPIHSCSDNILQSLLLAQKETDAITFLAFCLCHPYQALPPSKIKKIFTNNGNATKKEMQEMAYSLTNNKIFLENDHLADAYADSFYYFYKMARWDYKTFHLEPPPRFAHMHWLWE